jgi:hypothetical protein
VSARKGLLAVWRDAVRDSDLSPTEKLVAHTIATYMTGRGYAFPAKETIAAGASLGRGRRSVDAAVDTLEASGFLQVERSRGRRAFRYQATLPPTSHELRRSEWATATANVASPAANVASPALNVAPRATESALKRSKAVNDAAAPDGASSLPEGECWGCRDVGPLVGPRFHYCRACSSGIEALKAEGGAA